ncbi:S8 family serine peptidase [Actinoplanes sp. NPDC024001]|uniref:S8 family serine peptidase n=1 Tax=Actinoplanes sp. NPDC024001 TaxID=3154598 RepID=UPI0033D199D5
MHRRLPALLTTAILGLGVLAAPASAAPTPGAATKTQATAKSVSVTLITGDRVTVHGKAVSVDPGPGRDRVRFLTQTLDGHRFVIPADALGLLREGRLDKRLFDVTELAALNAGDELPLLVAHPDGGAPGARSALSAGEARVTRDLSAVGVLAVRADLTARSALWSSLTTATAGQARALRSGVQKVWLDGRRKLNLDRSVPQIGAPTAWQAGYDGTGVTVAVLDSGIDLTHPDFAGQIAGTQDFTGSGSVDDEVGHGTHVASTVAGTGAASGGRYKGVAPGAKLLIGKVCGTEFCMDSQILEGMIWAAERAPVVSMSLGGPDSPEVDPLEQAVNELTAQHDTLFVMSAGNSGFEGYGSLGSPSTADAALSVGAVDRDDSLAEFSSRGPRVGDGAVKPDITAPGVGIVAARAANDVIGEPAPVEGYSTLSGTSMSAPHVAGAAAILTQQHPGWSSRLRKNTLMASAKPTEGVGSFDQGAGRVDVARQITQTVTVDEGSISFGVQRWPHDDDQPITKTVTYRNSGTTAVDLTLAVSGGPFTVAASTLTVPAGGTATTTVTADTRGDDPDGPIGGYLTATAAGGVRVSTPIGVDKEVESYDVTIRTINRDGSPNIDHAILFAALDRFKAIEANDDEATQVVRIPKGRYGLFAYLYVGEEEQSLLVDAVVVIDADRTITIDARKAAPVRLTAPQAGAGTAFAAINADWMTENVGYLTGIGGSTFDTLYAGPISGATDPSLLASVNGTFAAPGAAGDFLNSPYSTDLAYFSPGRMFHGLRKSPRLSELAKFDAAYAAEATGARGAKANPARFTEDSVYWIVPLPFDLPARRTEYVNPQTQWGGLFMQEVPPASEDEFPVTVSELNAGRQPVRAGHTYRQDWNRAVFGPNVTQPLSDPLWVTRQGDFLIAYLPLSSDGAGHPGFSYASTETTALYRGNTKIGEGLQFEVPPEPATYRLEATAKRAAPHTLSTEIRASWTFRSGHVAGEQFQRLPVHTVRFAPRLDDRSAAPAGRRFEIPVFVEHQPGADVGRVRKVKVEVSYDDGRTWQKAAVSGAGDRRVATVHHPRGAGFASLRMSAADTAGNTVEQTLIRAYALR